MRVLLMGLTGGIGRELAPRLAADGHELRALSRRPASELEAMLPEPGMQLLQGDAVTGAGLERALADIDVAYYLIHSMESAEGAQPFAERERLAAKNFGRAAAAARVGRVVYLGGLIPQAGAQSPHLASRLAVERILLECVPDSVAVRASIVIGANSRSFRLLVRLLERMPVLPISGWGRYLTVPVDERDVIECLARAAADQGAGGLACGSYDLAGPETVSYLHLIERIRDAMLVSRPLVQLPVDAARALAGRVAALVADEDPALVAALIESLSADLLPWQADPLAQLGLSAHRLDAAIEYALRRWEAQAPLRAR